MAGARRFKEEPRIDQGHYDKRLTDALDQFELDANSEMLTILLIQLMQNHQIPYEVHNITPLRFDERSQLVTIPYPEHSSVESLIKIYQFLHIPMTQSTNNIAIPVSHFISVILPKLIELLQKKHEQTLNELTFHQMQTRARHSEPVMGRLQMFTDKICALSSSHLAQYQSRLDGIFGQCGQLSLLLNEMNSPSQVISNESEFGTNEKLIVHLKKMSLIRQNLKTIRKDKSATDKVPSEILELAKSIQANISYYMNLNKHVSVLTGYKCKEDLNEIFKTTEHESPRQTAGKALLRLANIHTTVRACTVSQRWDDPSRLVFTYEGLTLDARNALKDWIMKQGIKNVQAICRKPEATVDYSELDDSSLGNGPEETPRTSRPTPTWTAPAPIELTHEFFMDGLEFSLMIFPKLRAEAKNILSKFRAEEDAETRLRQLRVAAKFPRHKILADSVPDASVVSLENQKKLSNSVPEMLTSPFEQLSPIPPRLRDGLIDSTSNSNAEETTDSQSPRPLDSESKMTEETRVDLTEEANSQLTEEKKKHIQEAMMVWQQNKNSASTPNTPEQAAHNTNLSTSGSASPTPEKSNKNGELKRGSVNAFNSQVFNIFRPQSQPAKVPSNPEIKRSGDKRGSRKLKGTSPGN